MKTYGTTSSVTHEPVRFKREMTRYPASFNPKLHPSKQHRFDGKGGYAPNSGRIPLRAIPGAVVVVALFGAIFFVGTEVGF